MRFLFRRRSLAPLGIGLVLCLTGGASAQALPLLGPLSGLTKSPGIAPSLGLGASSMPAPPHAVVQLNNQILFFVYSSGDRDAQDRADLANLRLADALHALPKDGDVRPPDVTVDERGSEEVMRLDGQPLLTVTQADTTSTGETTDQLADVWAGIIRQAFAAALREREPSYRHWAIKQALLIALAASLVHLLLWMVGRRAGGHAGWPMQTLPWVVALRLGLDLFPQTRPVNNLLWAGALRPLTLCLVVCLCAATLARIWAAVLRRLFPPLPEHLSVEERTERTFGRRATLGAVVRVTGVTLIWIIALLVALTTAGINLSTLLASAGLIGVALGLAAQDSMKDLVSGINILSDDRFGVGDTIQVGAFDGKVERLTLRITQIRDSSGRLITLPNRNIAEVANLTARWAQVDFKVGISYFDDVQRAQDVLAATAQQLVDERPELALEAPQMLGVDSFNDQNITLRLLLRTPPGDQWTVARELRARVKSAFDAAGIAFLNSQYPPPSPARPDGPPPPADTAAPPPSSLHH